MSQFVLHFELSIKQAWMWVSVVARGNDQASQPVSIENKPLRARGGLFFESTFPMTPGSSQIISV